MKNKHKKAESKTGYIVGIDFGACNIKVVSAKAGKLRPLKLNSKDTEGLEVPNALYYKKLKKSDGFQTLIGKEAISRGMVDHKNSITDIKRKLELERWQKHIETLQRDVSASEAAQDVFGFIKEKIARDSGETEIHAVITVPVGFSRVQVGRLFNAATQAGIIVENVLTEPFAALFSLRELEEPKLALVFDFGGSTLDVSIVRVEQEEWRLNVTELAADGIKLGGLDVDAAICDRLLLPRHRDALLGYYDNDPEVARQNLLIDIEKNKKEMFADDLEEVDISIDPPITLLREEVRPILAGNDFRGRIAGLLDSLFAQLEEGPHGFTKEDINFVLPVGGTVRIPWFLQILGDYFPEEVFDPASFSFDDTDMFMDGIDDRYMAVAGGAARYAALMREGRDDLKITNVVPFRVGFMRKGKFVSCIAKNKPGGYESPYRPLPLDMLEDDNWRIAIAQSFSANKEDAIFIGAIELDQSLYEEDEPPLIKLRMTREGNIMARVFQRMLNADEDCDDDDDCINLIEEHILELGK